MRFLAPSLALLAAFGAAPGGAAVIDPPPLVHRIAVDVRGPVALVSVTRALRAAPGEGDGAEILLDVALPDRAALLDLEVSDGGRWRTAEPIGDPVRARDLYTEAVRARGVEAAREPFDDSAVYRIRVARERARAAPPVLLRYRFSTIVAFSDGRNRLRFPAAPERLPAPADVTVTVSGAGDVEIAGVRTPLAAAAGRGNVAGRASTRAGWEISWSSRGPAPGEIPALDAGAAAASLSPTETALAFAVRGRAGRAVGPPPNVLFLIDRSRSVGLPGLSAERDLARRLLEALPPATRFDALFFDRGTRRLFPMLRPATREAITALEAEMVPDRLQNGTDLPGALKEAAALLRREESAFAPRALLCLITDGALPDAQDGATLERALGANGAVDLSVAAFAVRVPDDEPIGPAARRALRQLAGARGGLLRELRANQIEEVVPAALAALDQGGDVSGLRLELGGTSRPLSEGLAPGDGLEGITRLPGRPVRAVAIEGTVHGQRTHLTLRPQAVDASWLRPHVSGGAATRLLTTDTTVALVEPVLHPAPAAPEAAVKGSMDRLVVRNTLSLAYMPRARACYLNRSAATPALRDLTGRVRLAIDLIRGEVAGATIESSSLNHPEIEQCLRSGAYAVEVPRALRSDAPVTAILNLVFRPRTPDRKPGDIDGTLGEQIDLIIEELHRSMNHDHGPE